MKESAGNNRENHKTSSPYRALAAFIELWAMRPTPPVTNRRPKNWNRLALIDDLKRSLTMRYVLMVLGVIALAGGILMFSNAHHPHHFTEATVVVLLGGIFLAIGMATSDIVEAIKGSRRS
jgi:hypothetical protein